MTIKSVKNTKLNHNNFDIFNPNSVERTAYVKNKPIHSFLIVITHSFPVI